MSIEPSLESAEDIGARKGNPERGGCGQDQWFWAASAPPRMGRSGDMVREGPLAERAGKREGNPRVAEEGILPLGEDPEGCDPIPVETKLAPCWGVRSTEALP